jgi:hypothetical protein
MLKRKADDDVDEDDEHPMTGSCEDVVNAARKEVLVAERVFKFKDVPQASACLALLPATRVCQHRLRETAGKLEECRVKRRQLAAKQEAVAILVEELGIIEVDLEVSKEELETSTKALSAVHRDVLAWKARESRVVAGK